MGQRRGRLTEREERIEILSSIDEVRRLGATQKKACEAIGISARTYQRWQKSEHSEDGRLTAIHHPPNKLTEFERKQIVAICNTPEFSSKPPSQIVPILAERGRYIASESSFYRVLKSVSQLAHREKTRVAKHKPPRALAAQKPNEIYSWDITYLPTTVKGRFLYLYMVMDVFSRKIVGWQVHEQESNELASDLIEDICYREKIKPNQVVLHSDNGGPMKGATMLATLQRLGVIPSFSRPSVSNDNPYSEALFRTLKFNCHYPDKPFSDINDSRAWVDKFVSWYNKEHRHSSICFVTPNQRHTGEDVEILKKRKAVYEKAKSKNASRWSRDTRNWEWKNVVLLNPEKQKSDAFKKAV